MAMKRCPYCAEEIQDKAIRCKHCGKSVKKSNWVWWVLGILVVLYAMGSNSDKSTTSPEDQKKNDYFSAEYYAREFVQQNLKAPSTSKFGDYNESHVTSLGNDEYTVSDYVDAQNAFGAMLRNYYYVKLQLTHEGDKTGAKLEDINISGN